MSGGNEFAVAGFARIQFLREFLRNHYGPGVVLKRNRSRVGEARRGSFAVETGFDGVAEPLKDGKVVVRVQLRCWWARCPDVRQTSIAIRGDRTIRGTCL